MNGGACGLIRQSTRNLTNVENCVQVKVDPSRRKHNLMVLHGCRQFVL